MLLTISLLHAPLMKSKAIDEKVHCTCLMLKDIFIFLQMGHGHTWLSGHGSCTMYY